MTLMGILNNNIHVNENGSIVPLEDSRYAWQPIGRPHIELASGKIVPVTIDLGSEITLPLKSKTFLSKLLNMMSIILQLCSSIVLFL